MIKENLPSSARLVTLDAFLWAFKELLQNDVKVLVFSQRHSKLHWCNLRLVTSLRQKFSMYKKVAVWLIGLKEA